MSGAKRRTSAGGVLSSFALAALMQQRLRPAGAREIDDEARPVPEVGVDGDPAAVTLDDQLDDVEAEAEARDRFGRGGALERLEDLLLHRGVDTWTAVDDLEVGDVGGAVTANPDLDRLARSVLHQIGDEVGDDLLEAQRVQLGGHGPV